MAFAQRWKTAKDAFQRETGRKKPSEKFLGVFRKSSGLENACKDLDSSLKEFNVKGMTKAVNTFERAKDAYLNTLERASNDENENYRQQVAALRTTLERMGEDYADDWNKLSKREFDEKLAKPMYEFIKQGESLINQTRMKMEAVESALLEADALTRAVVEAIVGLQEQAAGQALAKLKVKLKDVAQAAGELTKTAEANQKQITRASDGWAKLTHIQSINQERYDDLDRMIFRLGDRVKTFGGRARDVPGEMRTLLETATKAFNEKKADAGKVYKASIHRFLQRAIDLYSEVSDRLRALDNMSEAMAGQIEQFEGMPGGEARTKKKEQLTKLLSMRMEEIKTTRAKLDSAEKILKKEWEKVEPLVESYGATKDKQDLHRLWQGFEEDRQTATNLALQVKQHRERVKAE